MLKYVMAIRPESDRCIGYLKTGETTPTIRTARNCPKWILEIVKKELL